MVEITELIVATGDGATEKNDTSLETLTSALITGVQSGNVYDGLLRWQGLDVPRLAEISYATLKVYIVATNSDDFQGDIFGIDEDNTVTWSASNRGSQRSKTTANVQCDVADWTGTFSMGNWVEIDITSIIQEIINRDDWETGNDLGIVILSDTVQSNDLLFIHRYYGGYEGPLTYSPQLIIEYATTPYTDWRPVLTSIIR